VFATTGEYVTGVVSATGTITGGNLATGGTSSAAGNVTGGNVLTGGLISATGNVTGGNLITAGNVFAPAIVNNGTYNTQIELGAASGIIAVTTDGNATQFLPGGQIRLGPAGAKTILSGTLDGSQLVLGTSQTDLVQNRGGNVTVQVGNGGATTSTWTFANSGDLLAPGNVSATGNVIGGNVTTGGTASATGNITGGNLLTGGLISSTGTVTGSSILGTVVSVTGNITGGNISTTGLITTTGNIAGGNILSNNYYYANGQAIVFGVNYTANTTPPASPSEGWQWYNTSTDVLYEYLNDGTSDYWVDTTSPAFAGGVVANVAISGSLLVATSNVYDIGASGQTFRDVYATNYYGNGASLSGIITSVSNINNGTTNMSVVSSGGNIAASVGGTSNVMVITSAAVSITGDLSVSGNATLSGNILGDRIQNGTTQIDIQTLNGNANITVGGTSNVAVFATTGQYVTGVISATGDITGGNLTTAGILTVNSGAAATAIVNGAGNAVGNIGSSGTYFNRLFAQATTALYADLAEMYVSDAEYDAGTVVDFDGTQEITISNTDSSKRVAGVISTNPAHLMNSGIVGDITLPVALVGRVPVKVTGVVRKGDLMVSAGNGRARAVTIASPKVGTILGKALENFAGGEGMIELVIGKH
jgi:hypothetical protein